MNHPTLPRAACLLLLAAPLAAQDNPHASASQGQGSGRGGFRFSPARRVVEAADLNGDRKVDREEWDRFLSGFEVRSDGTLDPNAVQAFMVARMIDTDSDGAITHEDLITIFEKADKDIDFRLGRDELDPPRSQNATGRGSGRNRDAFMARLPLLAADADGNGEVDADEWGGFLDAAEPDADGRLDAAIVGWIEAVRPASPLDPNDWAALGTPGGYLRWVHDGLDANRDGAFRLDDLERFFDERDFDEDRVVRSDELSFSRSRGRSRRGRQESTPLMPWQRSLEDALALVEATGKPLLVCVNMDGEMASESLALSRYRDPAFVELAKGFIPLLVSPDRRNPRDHNDRGQRIVDAKFGRLVNAEHIDGEEELYRRYFDGRRVAPRHVGVAPDGEILFDVFLVNDLSVVDDALRDHGVAGPGPRDPGGMSEAELLASPWASHRDHLERTYAGADERTRARLASLALSDTRTVQHPELLRMALLDPSPTVRAHGGWTMIQHPELAPLDFFADAYLGVQGTPVAPRALVALEHLERTAASAEKKLRAGRLRAALEGLAIDSSVIDVDAWHVALSWSDAPLTRANESRDELTSRLGLIEAQLSAKSDPELHLAFAATSMRLVETTLREGGNPGFLLEDVVRSAERAAEGAPPARALAYRAWGKYLLADLDAARESSVKALPELLPWASTRISAKTLELFAKLRMRAVYAAIENEEVWRPADVADVRAAHEVLLEHPAGTETHAADYLTFLDTLGVVHEQSGFLHRALARFPRSGELHSRLRLQKLRTGGAEALTRAYDDLPVTDELAPTFEWYRGLALLMAAERHVQNKEEVQGLEAYEESVQRFLASAEAEADYQESASHYVCLAYAGRARVHADAGRWSEAVADLERGLDANPRSIWRVDGLGNAPRDTALFVLRSLSGAGLESEANELEAFLVARGVPL